MKTSAPKAKKVPKTLTAHHHDRQDDYYWLNQREDPEAKLRKTKPG